MKERPILFSGPMVRAILDGRKTQTRRPIKSNNRGRIDVTRCGVPVYATGAPDDGGEPIRCPFGRPGDRLWVRETWAARNARNSTHEELSCAPRDMDPRFAAVMHAADLDAAQAENVHRWRPSIHMPRWASRIDLEIVSIRVERLRDISEADARAEGAESVADFGHLWAQTYGAHSWHGNPWVWVVEFREAGR